MILKLPNLANLPRELREFVYSLRDWAKERERFEKSITSPSDTKSASGQASLRQGIVVDRTRVDLASSTSDISTAGDIIPVLNNTYNIGSTTFRWRDLFLGRNADIDGSVDIAGHAIIGSGISTTGISASNISLSGTLTGISFESATGGTLTLTGSLVGVTFTAGTLGVTSLIVGSGGISNAGGLTQGGAAHLLSFLTVDGAMGVTGTAAFVGNVVPSATRTANLGTAGLIWGNIRGGTVTVFDSLVIGGTLTSTQSADTMNLLTGNLAINGALGVTGIANLIGGVTITGGLTVSGGITSSGVVVGQGGGVFSNGVTITGLVNQSGGLVTLQGGISQSSAAVTLAGQLQAQAGLTVTGGVTIGGMVLVSSAVSNGFTGSVVPFTNLTANLGLTGRRWAQIFGGTVTLTNSATVGGTLTFGAAGIASSTAGSLQVATLKVNDSLEPVSDGAVTLGTGNPTLADKRWGGLFLSSILTTAKGTDITSGTTLSFNAAGNYFDVTGVSTVQGISYDNTVADPQAGIFNIIHLDSNAQFTHHATRLQMSGSTSFVGFTGDHLMLVSDGSGNWREAFRSYRPLAYGSCTSAFTDINWSQASAAQNTWYEITDTDMADGILSLVTHDGSGELTVTNGGVYQIAYSVTLQSNTANVELQSGIFINGSGNSSGGGWLEAVTANVPYQLSGTGTIRLAAGSTIDIRLRTIDASTPTITANFLDVTATQVGW